jgi:hypothetical protein
MSEEKKMDEEKIT